MRWDEPLPSLSGSPKQVAWAERIRAGVAAQIRHHRRELDEALANRPQERQEIAEQEGVLFAGILSRSEAAWWIERRQVRLVMLAREEQEFRRELEKRAARELRAMDPAPTPLPRPEYRRPPRGYTTH